MSLVLPQFPVGSVFMPHMPVELRVFEPQYLNLMGELMTAEKPVFGIPLLPQNVPAGEAPEELTVGTAVVIDDFGMTEQFIGITGTATRRFVVTKWLEADPYPKAEIEYLPSFSWNERLESQKLQLELAVRTLLARASQFGGIPWDADTEVSDEPVACIWQLAGMLPVDAEESYMLLCSQTIEDLMERTMAICEAGNLFLDGLEESASPDERD